MHLVLLSGGCGQRLWPLSSDACPKQFLQLFRREDGKSESMLQRVFRQMRAVDATASMTIATSEAQLPLIHSQLAGETFQISLEPCRRDTFPAIALAAAHLHDVQGVGCEEVVVVCPVDPYVDADYFHALWRLGAQAAQGTANLVLMGIEPTEPSEKYGYIIPEDTAPITRVRSFQEKPDVETAKQYLQAGALWNCGVFAFRLGYLLEKVQAQFQMQSYQALLEHYADLPKISFDYAVVEHEPEIVVQRFCGAWEDLGTWENLTALLDEAPCGTAVLSDDCKNTHVINELEIPVICAGVQDLVVVLSKDGILISEKSAANGLKPLIAQLDARSAQNSSDDLAPNQ